MLQIKKLRKKLKNKIFNDFLSIFLILVTLIPCSCSVFQFFMKLCKTHFITQMCIAAQTPKDSFWSLTRLCSHLFLPAHETLFFAAREPNSPVITVDQIESSRCWASLSYSFLFCHTLHERPGNFQMKLEMCQSSFGVIRRSRHVFVHNIRVCKAHFQQKPETTTPPLVTFPTNRIVGSELIT